MLLNQHVMEKIKLGKGSYLDPREIKDTISELKKKQKSKFIFNT